MKNRMIRYGVSSMFFHEYSLPQIFSFCDQAELDTVEFWFETPEFWLKGLPFKDLSECLQAYPHFSPISCHMPVLDLNPCSINPRVAEATLLYAKECYSLATLSGASVYTIHPGRRTTRRPPSEADFTRFSYYLETMQNVSQGSPVRVAIENMEPAVNSLLCTPEGMREVLDRETWLYFTLDVSHALSVSLDSALQYVSLCSDRMVSIHMSLPGPGRRLHYPVGSSREIVSLLKAIVRKGFDGTITFEIDDMNFPKTMSSLEKIECIAGECSGMKAMMSELVD